MQTIDDPPGSRPAPRKIQLVVGGRIWATWALIALNVLAFGWMLTRGASPMGVDGRLAYELGASQFHAVRVDGERWRLLTSTFLHAGVLHLFLNMWGLRILGPFAEAYLGAIGFLVLYLVSGIASSVVSTHFDPQVVTLGASGSIFAILGATLAFFVRHRREIPEALRRTQIRSMALLIALNVALGLSIPQVDNAAHLGGLVFGFVGGFLLDRELLQPPQMTPRRWIGATVFAALIVPAAHLALYAGAYFRGAG